ncbi:hypothetical protein [Aquicoccus sp.]|uniref:hypothetical protein n=1 Tax=Aquicoccus sp. TaxID=2055851 RepID=UPI003566E474
MIRALACLLVAFLAATPALAGAWPRAKGEVFLAAATRVAATRFEGPYSVYSTAYLEYGLNDRLTLGLDIGHGISGATKTIAFLQHPLPIGSDRHRFATQIGLGQVSGKATLRPGVSYGLGFVHPRGTGWFAIDSVAEIRLASGRTDYKSDITLGLSHGDRMKSIFQVQTGLSHGDPSFIRLAPSVAIRTGARSHLELGMTRGLVGDVQTGFKIGFWRAF